MASTTHIRGLDASLRKLKQIDPKLEREAKKRLKDDVKPIVQDAKASIPGSPPLSRWVAPKGAGADGQGVVRAGGSRLPIWSSGPAKRRIGVSIVRKRRSGYTGKMLLIRVRQMDAAGAVFDIAGRRNADNPLDKSLKSAGFGGASRGMWPAAMRHKDAVHDSIKASVHEVERQINAELRRVT